MLIRKSLLAWAFIIGADAVQADICTGVADYVPGSSYQAGDTVVKNNTAYQCIDGQWKHLCESADERAQPGASQPFAEIWSDLGNCDGVVPDPGDPIDTDGDGRPDNIDNCRLPNPDQLDLDNSGTGDVCERDSDGDGVNDGTDNCINTFNPAQWDTDGDELGDRCDTEPDTDNDGVADAFDNCPNTANTDQANSDFDTEPPTQKVGDACDASTDTDGDGVGDDLDNCTFIPNRDQTDTDGDGIGDACDSTSAVTPPNPDLPNNFDFTSSPVRSSANTQPLIMLGMSVDHELFKKAYNDYSDLDGGSFGVEDTTYRDDFEYYGYFHSNFCYTYRANGAGAEDSLFEPTALAVGDNNHSCPVTGNTITAADAWSGNFLNWVSMTRIDIIRRVLYGGKRSIDTTSETVLERAFIPNDAHAFVKVFPGNAGEYTPYTGPVSLCNVTRRHEGLPIIRVGAGIHRTWSTTGGRQCDDSGYGPDHVMNLVARVKVCVAGQDAENNERCSSYSSGNGLSIKPTGLLQKYGESGNTRFGLITGSYEKNLEGGVLRKTISQFGGNTSAAEDEVDLTTGIFNNIEGIVSNIDNLKIVDYSYSDAAYSDCFNWSIKIDDVKNNASPTTLCKNWGNPLSEIYLEALRYFSGAEGPTSAFVPTSMPAGLSKVENWGDPISAEETQCTTCSLIMLSTGTNSFDGDDLTSIADTGIATEARLDELLSSIGQTEAGGPGSSFAGQYYMGGMGDINQGRNCTAKTLDSLADAKGVCPDVPALEGSYDIAGMAYFAKMNDIRSDIPGDTTVSTYAVDLAESVPSFTVPVGDKEISFLPTCEANPGPTRRDDPSEDFWLTCAVFDVLVEFVEHDEAGRLTKGSYVFFWEDSQFGSDYDLDVSQRIRFCVGQACNDEVFDCPLPEITDPNDTNYCVNGVLPDNQIKIISKTTSAAAGNHIRLGYSITGTEGRDGTTAWAIRPSDVNYDFRIIANEHSIPAEVQDLHNVYTVSSGATQGVTLLEKPLYYAAKYGNFNDLDGDGTPLYNGSLTDTREWDSKDQDGNLVYDGARVVGDGLPDNYYQVNNPARLEESLAQVFSQVENSVGAGSSVAVVPTSRRSDQNMVMGMYFPQYTSTDSNGLETTIKWGGMLHSFFIDSVEVQRIGGDENDTFTRIRFREDRGIKGQLEDCSIDPVVEFYFEQSENIPEQRVRRLWCGEGGPAGVSSDISLDEFESTWNARNELAKVRAPEIQRSYDALISPSQDGGGRHILTSLDADTEATTVPFTTATLGSNSEHYGYLNVVQTGADTLVNFIRGVEGIPGLRNRTVNFMGDSNAEPWLLGDIVHSSPALVGKPIESYASIKRDDTYRDYQEYYKNRRQVVYVGANDGMIHAFNSGFADLDNGRFATSISGETAHPLGAELWAYVPMNLLPHLQWLAEPGYQHVPYMDGELKTFDVNIFPDDATHPNGWGTILVAGMRFGGGAINVDTDNDGVKDKIMHSAYVIFDITDPEQPPVLLGEINDTNMGFSLSEMELVIDRRPDNNRNWQQTAGNGATNSWKLVWGSGPDLDKLSSVTSSTNARLYTLDLNALVNSGPSSALSSLDLGISDAFTGAPGVLNSSNSDFVDDALFFGTVEGNLLTQSGRMLRYDLASGTLTTLINVGKPIPKKPNVQNAAAGSDWVFFGTGRVFVPEDMQSTAPQALYGVKDSDTTVNVNSLFNSSSVVVRTDGSVDDGSGSVTVGGDSVDTFDGLSAAMLNQPGWYIPLPAQSGVSAARSLTTPAWVLDHLFFDEFQPPEAAGCAVGDTYLHRVFYLTGTANPHYNFTDTAIDPENSQVISTKSFFAEGMISDLTTVRKTVIGSRSDAIAEAEDGGSGPVPTTGRSSWQQIFNWE